jgi:hypothetical protein
MRISGFAVCCALLLGFLFSNPTIGADRHSGYYYPPPQQIELYKARARILPDSSPSRRIGFVTAITHENLKRPYPPTTVFFAKGEHAEKLIIVAQADGLLDTIFRVRAYLASLSAVARTTAIFQEAQLTEILTFFDLARMLGFEQITVSDGKQFTHQIKFD